MIGNNPAPFLGEGDTATCSPLPDKGNVKKIVYSLAPLQFFPDSTSGKNYLSCSWGQGRFGSFPDDELVRS